MMKILLNIVIGRLQLAVPIFPFEFVEPRKRNRENKRRGREKNRDWRQLISVLKLSAFANRQRRVAFGQFVKQL